jgi:IMP dehydrogenase
MKAKEMFRKHKVEKLPLLNKDGSLAGLVTARTIENIAKYPLAVKDKMGRLRVGAAVGVSKDFLERAQELAKAGVDVLVIDVAHGHHEHTLKALKELKKKLSNIEIIAGNVATFDGARDLIKVGADAVKVGVGPGGLCTTRIVAGVGYPQLSAIMECAKIAHKEHIPLIADGGANYSGDITKALAAGASTIMLAGWLAGTNESPGDIIMRKGLKYKVHRGSASFLSVADRKLATEVSLNNKGTRTNLNTIVPEGVESIVPYKGAVTDVIYQLLGGLRSGMSYCNAITIEELWENTDFVQITSAGFRESNSHNIEEI